MFNIKSIKDSELFSGISEDNIADMLLCMGAVRTEYDKGNYIIRAGEEVTRIGIVESGVIQIIKEDADGECSLISRLLSGGYFAEALCCGNVKASPVSAVTETRAVVVMLDFYKILNVCSNTCVFHSKLIENMLRVVALKNLHLQERMEYLSKKTIRKRVMKYLKNASGGKEGAFEIPFNREELSEYLCIDRSALSRELMRLKEEKVIDYWKNQFKLLPQYEDKLN